MKNMIKNNSAVNYLYNSINNIILQIINRKKSLKIGSMSVVRNCKFGQYNTIWDHVVLVNTSIDSYSYVGSDTQITNTQIGKFCSLSSGIRCGLGIHPSKTFVSTHPIFFSTKKQSQIVYVEKDYFDEHKEIVIGNDVWIGTNAIILDGVTVGDGAIIGAGAVVTKDIPPYAIMGGIPAKLIRYRFSPDAINELLKVRWWNKDSEWLKANHQLFTDIEKFTNYMKENEQN